MQIFAVASVALLAASCGHSSPAIDGSSVKPVRVKVLSVSGSAGQTAQEPYSGTVEAGTSTTASFSVAGTIEKINVEEGQRVAKGQLIATVDGASLKNAADIAEATLAETRDAYERMKKLHDAQALPDMQWVAVQQKLKQAEAAAAIARTGMNDATLHSPMAGVVARKLADVGQNVAPGIPVVEIMDVSTLKVKIAVPEADLGGLTKDMKATVTAGERTYSAVLAEKGVDADALSHTYDVKFLVTDPDGSLLPGMICSVVPETAPAAAAASGEIVLPPRAMELDFDNSSYVWLKKNGVAERRRVTVGGLDSRGIIVTSGLSAADSVVIEGQQKLSSGLQVVAVN